MKHVIRVLFCIGLLVFIAGTAPTYAVLRVSGTSGGIDFGGTGTITHMQQPPIFKVYGDPNCIPHRATSPNDFTTECLQVDTSLLGNDIVRAEHVRISELGGLVRFGCPTCETFVTVGSSHVIGGKLSDAKVAELQALIDQFGAKSIRMAISVSGGTVDISSSVKAVGLDIKPDGSQNSFNPRSRGVIAVAILTSQSFDASSVDMTSLRFGVTGAEATPHHVVLDDVDDDGDTDLLVFFRGPDTEVDCDTLFTYISGKTFTGQPIAGTDSVAVVGCHQ